MPYVLTVYESTLFDDRNFLKRVTPVVVGSKWSN